MTAAIYTRISKDPLEQGAGVDRQERDCRAMLARAGHTDPIVYRDNDRSAWQANRRRPAWDDMLTAIRAGTITVLAVWHPDRLLRQPRDLETLIEAADRGLRIVSAGGGRDLGDPDDRFQLRILTAAACKSSDDSARRIRRSLEDRAAAGLTHGGMRPFGLTPDRTHLDPREAAAITTAADSILAGQSLRSVCADLNATGLRPTGKASTWSPATVRQMLRRPSIAGLQTHRGRIVGPTVHPAVLDEATWRTVCAVLTDPSRRITRSSAYAHLLTGLLHCGACGGRMRVVGKDQRGQYTCHGCFHCAASERAVDDVVAGMVDGRLALTDLPQPSGPDAGVLGELEALRRRLAIADEAFADDPDVTVEQHQRISRRLHGKIRALEAQLAASVVPPVCVEGWLDGPLAERRRVLAALLERVTLAPAGGKAARFDPARLTVSWR